MQGESFEANSIMNQCIKPSSFLSLWYACWLSWVKHYWKEIEGKCEMMGGRGSWYWLQHPSQTNHVLIGGCLLKQNKTNQNKTKKTPKPPKTPRHPQQNRSLSLDTSDVTGVLRNGQISVLLNQVCSRSAVDGAIAW